MADTSEPTIILFHNDEIRKTANIPFSSAVNLKMFQTVFYPPTGGGVDPGGVCCPV